MILFLLADGEGGPWGNEVYQYVTCLCFALFIIYSFLLPSDIQQLRVKFNLPKGLPFVVAIAQSPVTIFRTITVKL